MKRLYLSVISILCFVVASFAAEEEVQITAPWGNIAATLATPEGGSDTAVLIIAGSGPTDRNGNSGLNLNTFAYKMLADGLAAEGLAVMRYDKRAIGLSHYPAEEVPNLLFDDFVDDAALCAEYLRARGYSRIILAGHSEGGAIALLVATERSVAIDGIVLLSAAAFPMDEILRWQLSEQLMPSHIGLMVTANNLIIRLKRGERIAEESIPKELLALFHPRVQPFITSSMQHDPREVAARCTQPMLIISGGRDIQVTTANGEALYAAQPRAEHVVFQNMSHVLKDAASADRVEQLVSVYTNSQLPLTEGLTSTIAQFINNI
ncbi:MAG: alpha/beta fold hydrolase [Alistipes sp.]|nr:alpha/beta fold hydrolase [Alistipes sp.]